MKLIAAAMFNQEDDIIESFCRYTLMYCDELLLVRRVGAGNRCVEIVQNLINEGLPIKIYPESENCKPRQWMTDAAFLERGADWFMFLDPDEFIIRTDGQNPRLSFENFDEHTEYRIKWRSYLYDDKPKDNTCFVPLYYDEYRIMPNDWEKPAISRCLYEKHGARRDNGPHLLSYSGDIPNIVVPDDTLMCHYPVRNAPQIIVKAVTGWMSLLYLKLPDDHSTQYRYLSSVLLNGGNLSRERLRDFSNTYGLSNPSLSDKFDVGVASFPTGWFKNPIALKYTDYSTNEQNYITSELMRKFQEIISCMHSDIDKTHEENSALCRERDDLHGTINKIREETAALCRERDDLHNDIDKTREETVALCRERDDLRHELSLLYRIPLLRRALMLAIKLRNILKRRGAGE